METVIKRTALVLAVIGLVWLAKPTLVTLMVGGILVALGTVFRVWAAGHLSRSTELTTSGPYAYLRDPLYLGRFLFIVGFGVMAWGWALVVMLVGLGVFFANYMPRKHKREMNRLEKRYGEAYTRYAAQVHSLVPRLTRYPDASVKPWSFKQFWSDNREQYLIFGVIVLSGVFIFLYMR